MITFYICQYILVVTTPATYYKCSSSRRPVQDDNQRPGILFKHLFINKFIYLCPSVIQH